VSSVWSHRYWKAFPVIHCQSITLAAPRTLGGSVGAPRPDTTYGLTKSLLTFRFSL